MCNIHARVDDNNPFISFHPHLRLQLGFLKGCTHRKKSQKRGALQSKTEI